MSAETFISINEKPLSSITLKVPSKGPWIARCSVIDAPELSGKVSIKIGKTELSGTVLEDQSDTYALSRKLVVVGGGAGWGKLPEAKPYHSDDGVNAKTVASDLAADVGEELDAFEPGKAKLAADYVRHSGVPASQCLEDVIGGVNWVVDYEGKTQVGDIDPSDIDTESYEVLHYDPDARTVLITLLELDKLKLGSKLTERLDAPQTVREFEVTVDRAISVLCHTGKADTDLSDLFDSLTRKTADRRIFGKYRYRVSGMESDGRVSLQVVDPECGLPDLSPISMWPGHAGVHCELTNSAEVLVEFIEGNRTLPIITHFAGKDGRGFVPVRTEIETSDSIDIKTKQITTAAQTSIEVTTGTYDITAQQTISAAAQQSIDIAATSGAITIKTTGGVIKITGSGNATAEIGSAMVKLMGGADFVALSQKVDLNFNILKTIITTAFISVGAGLAANGALGAAQMAGFVPTPTQALQTKAT